MTTHPTLEELAIAAEDLLEPVRAAQLEVHLSGCGECQARTAALFRVTAVLAAQPAPSLPPGLAVRLESTRVVETQRRATARAPHRVVDTSGPRPTLGTLDVAPPSRREWLAPLLAAAALACVVGFGGYVLSANAGLNEPPLVAAVNTSDLGVQAERLDERRSLLPHRFSRAWQCAREATDGRITGLASTHLDGTPALLVYTRSTDTTLVTVVTGCDTPTPTAGPSALLPR